MQSSDVRKAVLWVYVNRVTTAGSIDVYDVTTAWAENTVTWNAAPVPGAILGSIPVSSASQWVGVDITPEVQAWLATPSQNHGVQLAAFTAANTAVQLDTKESTTTSHPAQLEIVLNGPAGATGPAGAAGPTGATGVAGPAGSTGPAGAAGATGATGVAGPAAYHGSGGLNRSGGSRGRNGRRDRSGGSGGRDWSGGFDRSGGSRGSDGGYGSCWSGRRDWSGGLNRSGGSRGRDRRDRCRGSGRGYWRDWRDWFDWCNRFDRIDRRDRRCRRDRSHRRTGRDWSDRLRQICELHRVCQPRIPSVQRQWAEHLRQLHHRRQLRVLPDKARLHITESPDRRPRQSWDRR